MLSKHSKEMEEMRLRLLTFNYGNEKENIQSLRNELRGEVSIKNPENSRNNYQNQNPLYLFLI